MHHKRITQSNWKIYLYGTMLCLSMDTKPSSQVLQTDNLKLISSEMRLGAIHKGHPACIWNFEAQVITRGKSLIKESRKLENPKRIQKKNPDKSRNIPIKSQIPYVLRRSNLTHRVIIFDLHCFMSGDSNNSTILFSFRTSFAKVISFTESLLDETIAKIHDWVTKYFPGRK